MYARTALCYNKGMKKILLITLCVALLYWAFGPKKEEIKNLHNPGLTVVAFGDSLTAGYGAGRENSYPSVLAKRISRPVVNLGLSGDTGAAAPVRLEYVLEQNPYMVLIEFGGNDFMRGVGLDETEKSIRQIVDAVQQAGAIAVLVDTGGYSQMARYTKLYKRIAKETGSAFVPGILDGIFHQNKYKSDQIHPNAAGYEIVADRVHKVIKPYL